MAQVAEQQGKYLAACLNADATRGHEGPHKPFIYRHLGSMASLGNGLLWTGVCVVSMIPAGLLLVIAKAQTAWLVLQAANQQS